MKNEESLLIFHNICWITLHSSLIPSKYTYLFKIKNIILYNNSVFLRYWLLLIVLAPLYFNNKVSYTVGITYPWIVAGRVSLCKFAAVFLQWMTKQLGNNAAIFIFSTDFSSSAPSLVKHLVIMPSLMVAWWNTNILILNCLLWLNTNTLKNYCFITIIFVKVDSIKFVCIGCRKMWFEWIE